jgi:hypothetical protein
MLFSTLFAANDGSGMLCFFVFLIILALAINNAKRKAANFGRGVAQGAGKVLGNEHLQRAGAQAFLWWLTGGRRRF